MPEHVYVVALTSQERPSNQDALALAKERITKKHKPCYSDERLLVFCGAEGLESVAESVALACNPLPVDYVLVQTSRERLRHSSPALQACFDGSIKLEPWSAGGIGGLGGAERYTTNR
jgi:hypothetical protein